MSQSAEVFLVMRADDAGSCRSANEAVCEACDAGAVRNVSLMVCGPAFDHAAELFAGREDLCLGLHVVLNAEWEGPRWGPVLPSEQVPSLIEPETGFFTHFPHDLQRRGFSIAEAVAEAEAQLERARAAGLRPSYLDEHMGVGWLPGLRDALADLARREGLIDAMTLPVSPLPVSDPMPDETPEGMADHWEVGVAKAPPGAYLVVTHPGKDAPDMRAFALPGHPTGVVARERDLERRALIELGRRGSLRVSRYDELR
ncbi:MAG: ChbG/HpnK family deacetylase [Capsulimonadales bacterium]|nr:ChbG/HpnK family deacetylase [Capsulimonadales bacterium]